jgi:hypothetical protein
MRRITILILLAAFSLPLLSQITDNQGNQLNAAQRMMGVDRKLTLGGYAQIDYNQPFGNNEISNGKLDVHRLVLLFGYKFSDRVQFITEIELEHVKEVYVEQAFVNYRFNEYLNLRAGLMLIPMGIVNEYHEPPTFNGVERPNVDYYIVPTTWREIGIGITGNIREASLKYQAYVVNGFVSYDGEGKLNGKYALRKGRQKGAKAIIGSPNIAGKVEYYGIRGLNIGLSGYFGDTQSTLNNGRDKNDPEMTASADSSIVSISMAGFDVRYTYKGLVVRGQGNYGTFSNTKAYNEFTGNDFAESILGYYIEAGYDIFHSLTDINSTLIPFVRYENYNTHNSVAEGVEQNNAYHREEIVTGIGWKPVAGVAFKADVQFVRPKSEQVFSKVFNMGVGIWF